MWELVDNGLNISITDIIPVSIGFLKPSEWGVNKLFLYKFYIYQLSVLIFAIVYWSVCILVL